MDERWLRLAIGHGTLDSGALVDPATVRRWACDADIVPMVLGSKSEPLDIGRRSRFVPDAMRRALNFRDGGCTSPAAPADLAVARPIMSITGATSARRASTTSRSCADTTTRSSTTATGPIDMIDGLPWFTPPAWIDPERKPDPADDQPPSSDPGRH